MSKRDDDDAVGYGKPPKATRFRKGQSGNPKGRPKGSRNFATDLDEVLNAKLTITEQGQRKKITGQQAALRRLFEQGLKGDLRALIQFVGLGQQRSAELEGRAAERSLTTSEDDILARHERDLLAKAGLAIDPGNDGEADDDD